jgi:hypothetical protein
VNVLSSTTNAFDGVVVDPQALLMSPETFRQALSASLNVWVEQGLKVVWSEHVGIFNKRIVQVALNGCNRLVPVWIEGYQTDPAEREIFMPPGLRVPVLP